MAIIQSGASTDLWTIDPTSKAGRVTLYDPAAYSLVNRRTTYAVGGRTAAGIALSPAAFFAQKQFLTIYHTSASTKTVKLRRAWIHVSAVSTACFMSLQLVGLTRDTAPATGNPAITPMPFNIGSAAAEATVLGLPTVGGSLVFGGSTTGTSAIGTVVLNSGVIAAPTTNSGVPTVVVLYDEVDGMCGHESPTMRPGFAEGWAITVFTSASSTIGASCGMIFTEE